MSNPLSVLLEEKGVLLADGATGTTLFDMGLTSGQSPEFWNDTAPEKITKLHQGFVDAGSDIILTNSFGGTRHRLKLHHAQDRTFELNQKAAIIAREVADKSDRDIIVAGSVGPTGELLVPLGELTYEGAVEAFVEQMEGLKSGGVDVLWIETMSAPDEMKAAAQAANSLDMPYVITASFDTAGRTMMGMTPAQMNTSVNVGGSAPLAIGANCGVGASDLLASVLDISKSAPEVVVIAKANCGIPVIQGENVVYTGTPELMSDYACLAIDAGARIIGGCCGTSCDHLAAMRKAIDTHEKIDRPSIDTITNTIGPMVNKSASSETASKKRGNRRNRV
ncbi:MAG: betaine--homocysteine S-methyltransferase [Hyphomicrobiales bacterium]|nr:betaine--homocysteine S-methyltransferase [Hyphomicrobiales bacterium]